MTTTLVGHHILKSLSTPMDTPFSEEQLHILESYHITKFMSADEPDLALEEEV